jgi:hypothetical protein
VSRRFEHLGRAWDVELTGASHGVGFGVPPKISSWGVWFRPADEPSAGLLYGSIRRPDPAELSEDELRKCLEAALVLKALEDPDWDWRTVEGVAQSTGLPVKRVQEVLESSAAVMRSSVPDERGRPLYTTREHYRKRRSFFDFLRST